MAEQRSRSEEGGTGQVPFADFVAQAPSAAEAQTGATVTLTGTVFRSPNQGQFTLALPTGQSVDLSTDAVRSYQVIPGAGTTPMVQLEVASSALPSPAGTAGVNPTLTIKELIQDQTFKELIQDQTIKELIKDPIVDQTFKELTKDPVFDTLKEATGDPTLPEGIGGGGGTAVEVPGGGLPGGGVLPVAAAGAPGARALTPFVLATPHHAPQAAVAMQNLAAGMNAGQIPPGVTIKELQFDQTLKELTKDPAFETVKELIFDTFKELIGDTTLVENIGGGGGTAAEGIGGGFPGGVVPPVWGFPGLMF